MKILFAGAECAPFIKTGGLGDVIGALPGALAARPGVSVRVFLPLYGQISEAWRKKMRFVGHREVPVSWRRQYCGLYELKEGAVFYYFLDNEYYFKREGIYGHGDDAERFSFFCRAIAEMLPLLQWYPDVVHAHDWHGALLPVFLNAFYRQNPRFQNIRSVFTIHNIQFQGNFGPEIFDDVIGVDPSFRPMLEFGGGINLMKGGIEAADIVTTVSRTYASEILLPYFSYGLDPILNLRRDKLTGIVNGIDDTLFDPAADPALNSNYSLADPSGKTDCKRDLCARLDLPYRPDTPVLSIVSRLTDQKGLDLVAAVLERLLAEDVQLVVLGTGDPRYEDLFRSAAARHPNRCRTEIRFDTELANRIYAGSDIFLMPSLFEPCGLSQMIAMRYGTPPVVRLTGGLVDTVPAYDPTSGEGCGFTFGSYNADDFYGAVRRALELYRQKDHWSRAVCNCLAEQNGWPKSAAAYYDIYRKLSGKR